MLTYDEIYSLISDNFEKYVIFLRSANNEIRHINIYRIINTFFLFSKLLRDISVYNVTFSLILNT